MNQNSQSSPPCCVEYEAAAGLSRRRFMAGMAAASTTAVTTSVFGDAFRQAAFGATTGNNVLVVLSLRGGVDGMGLVVPHGDPAYAIARPTIALPKSSLLAPDAMFGLHPNMGPLKWLWDSGELAAVQAVGLPIPNRSHFSAIEEIEDADSASSERRGWINRMIGLDANSRPTDAVYSGAAALPTSMVGPAPGLAIADLSNAYLIGEENSDSWATRRRAQLEMLWGGNTGSQLYGAFRGARQTADILTPVAKQTYTPTAGVTYSRKAPATDLSDAMRDTARLIKADIGTDVVTIDFGSWDMHADYGTTAYGRMQSMVSGLAGVLDSFMRDLGPVLRQRVTVVTISEFGRRLKENGNHGLDHGWGNMMLLAGAGVKGGKYYGQWPGLGSGTRIDDDLKVTTDYRNVFAEILATRFPERSLSQVFPGLSYAPVGLMNVTASTPASAAAIKKPRHPRQMRASRSLGRTR